VPLEVGTVQAAVNMGQGQPRINQAGNHIAMTYKDGGPFPFNLVMYLILILISSSCTKIKITLVIISSI